MIPFFVQIKCQLGKSYDVASKLADAEIASEIYSTAGEFDLLVKFYVEPSTDIGHFIAEKVQTIPGIADTRTSSRSRRSEGRSGSGRCRRRNLPPPQCRELALAPDHEQSCSGDDRRT